MTPERDGGEQIQLLLVAAPLLGRAPMSSIFGDTRSVFTLVNHHHLREPIPESAYEALSGRFDEMRQLGLQTFQVIRVADDHLILIAVFDSGDAADEVSELIGSPWLREHVIPRLSSPTEQSFGEAVCSLGF